MLKKFDKKDEESGECVPDSKPSRRVLGKSCVLVRAWGLGGKGGASTARSCPAWFCFGQDLHRGSRCEILVI